MKYLKILLLLVFVAGFNACDPLEDDIADLDLPTTVKADIVYTLTEDDYAFAEKPFGSFDSDEEAKDLIPDILVENYPQFGNGSSALVTYDVYDPIRTNNEDDYTLTTQDYDDLGQTYGTLSSDGDIIEAVEFKYPDAEPNDLVTLTYEWYCGGCSEEGTRTSIVANYDGTWSVSYVPTDDDYTFMGQSYPNFESRTTARERISYILGQRYPFDDEGSIRTSVFVYTYVPDGGSRVYEDFLAVFEFDGESWAPFQDVVSRTLQLGHDGEAWVPDNTIKYALSSADYEAIAVNYEAINPGGAASMASYGNYDMTLWTLEDRKGSLAQRLEQLFPKVIDQKYLVSYSTWEPGAGTRQMHLIYTETGYECVQESCDI